MNEATNELCYLFSQQTNIISMASAITGCRFHLQERQMQAERPAHISVWIEVLAYNPDLQKDIAPSF